MSTEKKDPIIVDGKPLYTLSSYDPVTVVVYGREVSDEEVDKAVWRAVMIEGGSLQKMADDEWIHHKFPEVQNIYELREVYRRELENSRDPDTALRKKKECANALAARLEQRVLQSGIKTEYAKISKMFNVALHQNKLTKETYLARSGKTEEDIAEWLNAQSVALAEQVAAISAYAREREIAVTKDEVLAHVKDTMGNVNPTSFDGLMRQMSMMGRMEEVRENALYIKVLRIVTEESHCTYDINKPLDKYDPANGYPAMDLF